MTRPGGLLLLAVPMWYVGRRGATVNIGDIYTRHLLYYWSNYDSVPISAMRTAQLQPSVSSLLNLPHAACRDVGCSGGSSL